MRPQFETLRERLLRAGIAPRHVRRYLGELAHHFDDIVRDETAKGRSRVEAETVAQVRLGSEDALAAALLDRPGLRSLTSRAPWLVFGLAPVAVLLLVVIASAFFEVGLLKGYAWIAGAEISPGSFTGADLPVWLMSFIWTWNQLVMYAAPFALAALVVVIGTRQRIGGVWILIGVAIAAIAGGFHVMEVRFADQPGQSALSAGFGLVGPFPNDMTAPGIGRAAINLVLIGTAYWLWHRRPFVAVSERM
jgi:hypothetical protein